MGGRGWGGGDGGILGKSKEKVLKCQDLPKFLFLGRGGV